jgi:hypothetical protein
MKRHSSWRRTGLGLVALVASGCADDFVDPFTATEGMSSSGSGDTSPQPDDDGQDDGVDSTGSGSGSGGSDSGGSTMSVVDDSSTGEPVGSSSSEGGEESSSSGGEESSSTGEMPPNYEPCPEGVLPNAPLPSTVNASSAGEDSEFSSTCGGGGAPDIAWLFTAPADGDYTFDTLGSSVDTVLYVLDGECTGPELQCDDDGIVNTTQSMMSVPLLQDQTVTVVADSFGLLGGNVQLTVREGSVSCPVDIGSTVPQTVSSQTQVATDEFTGSCGSGAAADQGFLFTPPVDGTYTFETTNNTFDTLIYILDGVCEGSELACNDNLVGSVSGASGLALGLPAGQPVTIVVDGAFGGGGTFDLNIGLLGGTCPDDDLGNMAPPFTVSDTTVGEDNAHAASCGGLASNDVSYTWTAPFEATFSFDTFGSAFDTVVYVLDGNCTGPEIACSNDTLAGTTSSTIAHLAAGEDAVIVVDGNGAEGNFDLNVSVDCPAADLGNTVPQVHSDNTLTGSDAFVASCAAGGGPDEGFTFTAPSDGTYTFEIANNDFDTILSALDGVCGGAELVCNDNLMGSPSGASGFPLPLSAGQEITLVVDGFFGAAGNFDLVIGQLSGTCPDENLGNMAVPFTVNGTTVGEDNSSAGSCGGLGSNDYTYTWTAPAAATYRFSTEGSAFDTVAYVRNGANCGGAELGCGTGSGMTTAGATYATLAAGQTVNIFVDGEGAASGAFTLTVEEATDSGNCCFAHATTGCDDPIVEGCVCGIDSFCCSVSWDSLCQDEAINICGAVCP